MPYVTRTIEPAVAEFIRRPEPHKNVLLVEGARQVGKHTDITAESRGDVAHHAYQSSMPIGRPMRKIDPHNIDAGKNQSLDGGRIT